ncbi:hypothetical protein SISSUDRAFT_955718, partial [Sistotremastrum suecicum HHB10207 ss-3]
SFTKTTSLTIAVTHAIAFLTRPLVPHYSSDTIERLHHSLQHNLETLLRPSWSETDDTTSGCLTLSPNKLPHAAIWRACNAASIHWSEWMSALGGREFDLFIQPGCVSFRLGAWGYNKVGPIVPLWSVDSPSSNLTLAQSIVDEDEDDIFSMIAEEIKAPTWMTPLLDQFPDVPVTATPFSIPSRSSSRSSASSDFSMDSAETSDTYSSATSLPSQASDCSSSEQKSTSSRSRARRHRTRVYIDASKKEVTPYDGGKTTVLTGGVMLGAPPAAKVS